MTFSVSWGRLTSISVKKQRSNLWWLPDNVSGENKTVLMKRSGDSRTCFLRRNVCFLEIQHIWKCVYSTWSLKGGLSVSYWLNWSTDWIILIHNPKCLSCQIASWLLLWKLNTLVPVDLKKIFNQELIIMKMFHKITSL